MSSRNCDQHRRFYVVTLDDYRELNDRVGSRLYGIRENIRDAIHLERL